jgi:hypothetical protein
MLEKSSRINVSFGGEAAGMINHLAQLEHKSVAGMVRTLALEALEMREDLYFSKLANELDQEDVKLYSHEEAWK